MIAVFIVSVLSSASSGTSMKRAEHGLNTAVIFYVSGFQRIMRVSTTSSRAGRRSFTNPLYRRNRYGLSLLKLHTRSHFGSRAGIGGLVPARVAASAAAIALAHVVRCRRPLAPMGSLRPRALVVAAGASYRTHPIRSILVRRLFLGVRRVPARVFCAPSLALTLLCDCRRCSHRSERPCRARHSTSARRPSATHARRQSASLPQTAPSSGSGARSRPRRCAETPR